MITIERRSFLKEYLVFSVVFEFLIDVFQNGSDELHEGDDKRSKRQRTDVIPSIDDREEQIKQSSDYRCVLVRY